VANTLTGGQRSQRVWLLFSLKGRISRTVYWLSLLFWNCVIAALVLGLLPTEPDSISLGAAMALFVGTLLAAYSSLAITVKRLHDVGYGGFLSAAMFIPLVNIVFTVWVGIVPGTIGPNTYGDMTDSIPA
jgi:uncharacterized membrane protein YhaH (DUF805 family)